jgi:protein SCO1/2
MKRALLALMLLASGCRENVPEQRFELQGRVVSVDAAAGTVTVDHRPVEGFMAAMTMPLPMKDRWAFDRLEPGDGLVAVLVVQGKDYWLEGVVLSRSNPTDDVAEAASEPAPGTDVPDAVLVNQSGAAIRLSDYRGKALLLTFLYTRCPLVEFCPRMTNQFAALESKLREVPALYQRSHLLSVSFDPEFDTPEKLERYAWQMAEVKEETFEHWEFAVADPENLELLSNFFGLQIQVTPGEIVHNLRTALLGPDGKLVRIYRGNEWTADEVFSDVAALGSASAP